MRVQKKTKEDRLMRVRDTDYYFQHVFGARVYKPDNGWMLHEILDILDPSKQLLLDTGMLS